MSKDYEDNEKYIEEKTEFPIEKNKKKKIIILSIVSIIVILVITLIAISFIKWDISRDDKKEKLELKYTETNKVSTDSVYITDVSKVVENVIPSIVAITSKTLISSGNFGPSFFGKNQYTEGAGSGIIISKSDSDLMILTNNHVVANASELSVQFINEKSYDAKIVGTSERKDIAIISVSLNDIDSETLNSIKIATIGDSNKLKVGNGIIAIGNALGYGQSVTTGVVSALNREVTVDNYKNKMIQIDAAINGGNSGGALLNNNGEVVGINSAKYSASSISSSTSIEGMGFAIPISDIKDLIETLMNGEEDSSASIGVAGYIIKENNSRIYNMPEGFYITKVVAGSGADKAGIEIGNIITKILDNKIEEFSDIQNSLDNFKKGDQITVTISYVNNHEYQEKELKVTLT